VDESFLERVISPHLLHLERLEKELISFDNTLKITKIGLDKSRYKFFECTDLISTNDPLLLEIKDIVDFSIDQIKPRIQLGYKICTKYKQVLF
jgi:hypothetical protein